MTPTNSNSLLNPPQSAFEKSDWPNLCLSLKSIYCSVFDSDKPIDVCIDELIEDIGNKCSIHVLLNRPKKAHISKFHRERKILMRRRSKLCKKTIPCPNVTQELIDIEAAICSSHHDEKLFDESRAVAKIKDDPEYFFRFAKISSICVRLTLVS